MVVRRPTAANWATLPLLMVAAAFGVIHPGTVAPFLNEMATDIGVSKGVVGQLGTVTPLAMALAAISAAPFVSRLSLRSVLVLGLIVLGATSILTGLVPSFAALLVIRFIAGIGGGMVAAGCVAALGRAWQDAGVRARRQGFVIGALAGGPGLVAPILRLVAEAENWEFAQIAAGGFLGVAAFVCWLALPAMPGRQDSAVLPLRERLLAATRVPRLPIVGPVLLLRMMASMAIGCTIAYLAGFVVAKYVDAEDWIGPIFAGGPSGFMLAGVFSGWLMPRLGGPLSACQLMVLIQLAAMAMFAWVTPAPAFTVAIGVVHGFGFGLYMNALVGMLYEYSGRDQSAAMFLDGAASQMGAVVGVALGGVAVVAAASFLGYQVFVTAASAAMLVPLVFARRSASRQAALAARS